MLYSPLDLNSNHYLLWFSLKSQNMLLKENLWYVGQIFNALSSSGMTNFKGKNADSFSHFPCIHYFMTHFLRAWRISSESPNLQESRYPGQSIHKWIVYKGTGYLKFMPQSRIKVDKPFLYCHHREEKDKWILMALYLFLHISPEKDFPGHSIFAKLISRGTVLFNWIFARFTLVF